MSKNSKIDRAARTCQRATGIDLSTAKGLARSGIIDPISPVPDAEHPSQRALEAQVLYALVEAFGQTDRFDEFLGLDKIGPERDCLTISVPPGDVGIRAISHLLPVYDPEYGGVVGVRGLRLFYQDPHWIGRSVLLEGSPHLVVCGPEQVIKDGIAAWRCTARRGMRPETARIASAEERRTIGLGMRAENATKLEDNNLALSRVLRRYRLFRQIEKTHGLINVYHHAFHDLQLEWCCGPTVQRLHQLAVKSGMFAPAPAGHTLFRPRLTPPTCQNDADSLKWRIGQAHIVLRRNRSLHDSWTEFGRPGQVNLT